MTKQVRGQLRELKGKELLNKFPSKFIQEAILDAPEMLLQDKNAGQIRFDQVLYKIRSEVLQKQDKSKDDIIDMVLTRQEKEITKTILSKILFLNHLLFICIANTSLLQ